MLRLIDFISQTDNFIENLYDKDNLIIKHLYIVLSCLMKKKLLLKICILNYLVL